MFGVSQSVEYSNHLIPAQDDGQLALATWSGYVLHGSGSAQDAKEVEFDRTYDLIDVSTGDLPLIDQVKEVRGYSLYATCYNM